MSESHKSNLLGGFATYNVTMKTSISESHFSIFLTWMNRSFVISKWGIITKTDACLAGKVLNEHELSYI